MTTAKTWGAIQARIWSCEACKGHGRVQVNLRQQTPEPTVPVRLLFVGVAPPAQGSAVVKTKAKSATNDPRDNLRNFIETAAGLPWEDLTAQGAFLIHAVKCT